MIGSLPTELLGYLERQGLRALGVIRSYVDVHERPGRMLARELRAEPVHIVVVPVDGDYETAVYGRCHDLAGSRSCGMNTTDCIPTRAAWAATEFARLPVDAHAATLNPSSRAFVSATDTTRSLNDPVGLAVSSLIQSSPSPSSAASRSALDEGGHAGSEVDRRAIGPRGGNPRTARLSGPRAIRSAARHRCIASKS